MKLVNRLAILSALTIAGIPVPSEAGLTPSESTILCNAFQYYAVDYSSNLSNLTGSQHLQNRFIPRVHPHYDVHQPLVGLSDAEAQARTVEFERRWNQEGRRVQSQLSDFCGVPTIGELARLFVECYLFPIHVDHLGIPGATLLGPLNGQNYLNQTIQTGAQAMSETVAHHRNNILNVYPDRTLARQPLGQLGAMEERSAILQRFLERLASGRPCGGPPPIPTSVANTAPLPHLNQSMSPPIELGPQDFEFRSLHAVLAVELLGRYQDAVPSSHWVHTRSGQTLLATTAAVGARGILRYVVPRLAGASLGSGPAGWAAGGCVVLAGLLLPTSADATTLPEIPLSDRWTQVLTRLEEAATHQRACSTVRDFLPATICGSRFRPALLAALGAEAATHGQLFDRPTWDRWIELEQRRACRPRAASSFRGWIQSGQAAPWIPSPAQ